MTVLYQSMNQEESLDRPNRNKDKYKIMSYNTGYHSKLILEFLQVPMKRTNKTRRIYSSDERNFLNIQNNYK